MDTSTPTTRAWHERPVPALLVGLSLLAVCAACVALWLTTTSFGIRAIGLASGAAGAYFTWGGINGLKEERK